MAKSNINTGGSASWIVPLVDYSNLRASLATMTERDEKANELIGKTKALKGQIMTAVHESEREGVANRFDQYTNVINNDISVTGYAGDAYRTALRIGQEAGNDYYFLGRMAANKAYTDFINSVDSADISDSQKEYVKAMNPYYYYDKYANETEDEAIENRVKEGEQGIRRSDPIVGGTTWTPNTNIVAEYGSQEILAEALKLVTADKGGYESIEFRDLAGNIVDENDPTGYYFGKNGNTWEKLSSDKIEAAIKQVLETNPKFRNSLNRQYDIFEWEYDYKDKSKINGEGIWDNNGIKLSKEDFINKQVQDIANSKVYNHKFTTKSVNDDYYKDRRAQAAAARAQAKIGDYNQGDYSTNYSFKIDLSSAPADAKSAMVISEDNITSILGKVGASKEDIQALLNKEKSIDEVSRLLSPDLKVELSRELGKYYENRDYYDNIVRGAKDDVKWAIDFIAGAISLDGQKTGNRYSDLVSDYLSGTSAKGGLGLTANDDVIISFADGGLVEKYKQALGIEPEVAGNKSVIRIKANDYNSLLTAASLYTNDRGLSDVFKFGELPVSITTTKEKVNNPNATVLGSFSSKADIIFQKIGNLYHEAVNVNDKYLKSINKSSTVISNLNLPGMDFADYENLQKRNAGLMDKDIYTDDKSALKQDLDRKLMQNALINHDIYVMDRGSKDYNNGLLTRVDDGTVRQQYNDILQYALSEAGDHVVYSPGSMAYSTCGFGTNVTILPHTNSKGEVIREPITIYVDGLHKNEAAQRYARDTTTRAKHKYVRNESIAAPIYISGTGTAFDGLNFTPNSATKTAVINIGGTYVHLPQQKVEDLIDGQLMIQDIRDQVKSGNVRLDESSVATMASYLREASEKMCNAVGTPNDINKIYTQLCLSIFNQKVQ